VGNSKNSSFASRYELLKSVGAGSFGQVWLARRKRDDVLVAVKKIDLGGMDEKARTETRNEVDVLRMLDHPNVTRYHEALVEAQQLHIVMEYVSEGDLTARVKQLAARGDNGGRLTEDEVMWYFVQICLALHHLHGQGILHRDLKAQNIFIAAGDIVKLGDFGISKVLGSQTGFCSTVVGTPYYLSPEMCMGKHYNKKSDIWAMGCVLYELITQKHAFEGNSLPALVMKILKVGRCTS
jgi:NIMA (never in mitosis gene a)-related kinase